MVNDNQLISMKPYWKQPCTAQCEQKSEAEYDRSHRTPYLCKRSLSFECSKRIWRTTFPRIFVISAKIQDCQDMYQEPAPSKHIRSGNKYLLAQTGSIRNIDQTQDMKSNLLQNSIQKECHWKSRNFKINSTFKIKILLLFTFQCLFKFRGLNEMEKKEKNQIRWILSPSTYRMSQS